MRILAADDDRITRKLLGVNLERWGYEVVMASDGLEAWEILQDENAPEIVVLDWVMPGMDGIEVCRALRKQSDRPYRYVILLAPKTQKNDVLAAFEAGADDHLSKPVNLRELEERLTTAVRGLEARKKHGVMPTRPGDLDFEPDKDVTKVEPESPTQSTLAGKVVGGKYRVVRPIASGGMGSVWEGTHLTLGTRVAIKFIRPEYAKDDDSMARFETEARVMARLQSRYAVHVYDYGFTPGGLPYLVMEYLEGLSLTGVIEQGGPLPLTEVVHVMSQAAHALEKAHRLGIIHRDVKPENIMLVPDADAAEGDNTQVVKLVDFGVAKVLLEGEVPAEVTHEATRPAPSAAPPRAASSSARPRS
jgi:CheY-like chemotaxis protein